MKGLIMSKMNISKFYITKKIQTVIDDYIKKNGYSSEQKIIQALFDEKTKVLYQEIIEKQRIARLMLEDNNLVSVDE